MAPQDICFPVARLMISLTTKCFPAGWLVWPDLVKLLRQYLSLCKTQLVGRKRRRPCPLPSPDPNSHLSGRRRDGLQTLFHLIKLECCLSTLTCWSAVVFQTSYPKWEERTWDKKPPPRVPYTLMCSCQLEDKRCRNKALQNLIWDQEFY